MILWKILFIIMLNQTNIILWKVKFQEKFHSSKCQCKKKEENIILDCLSILNILILYYRLSD